MSAHAKILKSRSKKNPFKVRVIGENGEILVTSELLTTRRNCIKNILATLKVFGGAAVRVEEYNGNHFVLRRDGFESPLDKLGDK